MLDTRLLCVTLWVAMVLAAGSRCPDLCTCSDKQGRYVADCSFKGFAEVPEVFPPAVSTLSLSANRISSIRSGNFHSVAQLMTLWLANNKIATVEEGSLARLVHLRNFDISHNNIVNFPWGDLQNLTNLQLLKMDHNKMVHLPKDAFSTLKDLRYLRLNNNKFITIAEGTFDGLLYMSHLQIDENPFACTCSLDWLRTWISTTSISVPDQQWIVCDSPENLKGRMIHRLGKLCEVPNTSIQIEPDAPNATFYEGTTLILNCQYAGNPKPLVMWSVYSRSQKQEVPLSFSEDDSSEASLPRDSHVRIFNNGTLIVSSIREDDSGNYSCSATNERGRAEDSVFVTVISSSSPTAESPKTTAPSSAKMQQSVSQATGNDGDSVSATDILPSDESAQYPPHGRKCGLTANARYVSSYVINGSLDDIKQYTFDFGVVALGVTETEATVRLNPFLISRDKGAYQTAATTAKSLAADSDGRQGLSSWLYLCVTTDHKHAIVQWSKVKGGVSLYRFAGLRPNTNYSLCLTYEGEDCEVQVLFTTRRRVPNLLIIISVSICLLTVSTVPLLGAMCFHLVYKYRSKTYKLILKAKDQCHLERNVTANFHLHRPHTDSQSQLDEEEEEAEMDSGNGDKEADTEESVMTESFSLSHCRANSDNCDIVSENSDRLPLGAEAVNIVANYPYPNL